MKIGNKNIISKKELESYAARCKNIAKRIDSMYLGTIIEPEQVFFYKWYCLQNFIRIN